MPYVVGICTLILVVAFVQPIVIDVTPLNERFIAEKFCVFVLSKAVQNTVIVVVFTALAATLHVRVIMNWLYCTPVECPDSKVRISVKIVPPQAKTLDSCVSFLMVNISEQKGNNLAFAVSVKVSRNSPQSDNS